MSENNSDMEKLLTSAAMESDPDPAAIQAVRQRMIGIAGSARARRSPGRTALILAIALISISAVGLAATETGRDLIRRILIPIHTVETVEVEWTKTTHSYSSDNTGNTTYVTTGVIFTRSRGSDNDAEPYTAEEKESIKAEFQEIYEISQAGGGRLIGLSEGPGWDGSVSNTGYRIEYTLASGETQSIGSSKPTGKQAQNMQIDEIIQLRDAGEGEIVSQDEFPKRVGLGRYTIRFTLSDGRTIDLETCYPPSTKQQREAIFAETRELREKLDFSVRHARRDPSDPQARVWGVLQYELSDGRTVGVSQTIPPELISPDGKHVVMPGTEEQLEIQGAGTAEN